MLKTKGKQLISTTLRQKGLTSRIKSGCGYDTIEILDSGRRVVASGTITHDRMNANSYEGKDFSVTLGELKSLSSSRRIVNSSGQRRVGSYRQLTRRLNAASNGWSIRYEEFDPEMFEKYRDQNEYGVELVYATAGKAKILYYNDEPVGFVDAEDGRDGVVLHAMASFKPGGGRLLLADAARDALAANKELAWMADQNESIEYYAHLGLDKYITGKTYGNIYKIPVENLRDLIEDLEQSTGGLNSSRKLNASVSSSSR